MVATVTTDKGENHGSSEEGLWVFRGIPYAAAPTGDLRRQPSQPHPSSDGGLEFP
mgnify:CR=1 FL=1